VLLAPLAVAAAPVVPTLLMVPVGFGWPLYSAELAKVTQFELAAGVGVYGTVVIGPRDSGGWKYVEVTPLVV
jgi:hypothetical protein